MEEIIFIDNLPKLDLHGFDRETARVLINDFIIDNIKMKNRFVVIIHGIGEGIIKNITFETLLKNKNVEEYRLWPSNIGCTVVKLNLTKK